MWKPISLLRGSTEVQQSLCTQEASVDPVLALFSLGNLISSGCLWQCPSSSRCRCFQGWRTDTMLNSTHAQLWWLEVRPAVSWAECFCISQGRHQTTDSVVPEKLETSGVSCWEKERLESGVSQERDFWQVVRPPQRTGDDIMLGHSDGRDHTLIRTS